MTAGRASVTQMSSICEILERIGPLSTRQLMVFFPNISRTNIKTICRRAQNKGKLTSHEVPGKNGSVVIFTIVRNWREIENKPQEPQKVASSVWRGVSSVFDLSSRV